MTENVSIEGGELAERSVLGERTRECRLTALECPLLESEHIAHVGVCEALPPYEIVRMDLGGAYLLSCFEGEGVAFLDGRWQRVRSGWAFLAPPHVVLAFRAERRTRWGFSWVRMSSPAGMRSPVNTSSALTKWDPHPMRHAILGLLNEVRAKQLPASEQHWVRLVSAYLRQFVCARESDTRLEKLWALVETDLGSAWSLERLSAMCHLSSEHLRRLCRRELGRSPVHHVIYLRMRRAAELLASTDEKVETISRDVGYANAFVFSNTFKRWVGWRPSEYRRRAKQR